MTSRLTRGPKPTGPFPNPGRHSCVTDTKFRSNKIIIRINHREGRSPHTRNRSLILHSVAEQNGVSIPERGRHHPSGIAAPRRAELASGGVCRFFVMSFFVTKPPKETPENHLTSGHRVAPEGEGSARGRPPHKNSHPPRPRFYVERMSVCTESITRGARRDDVTTKWRRLTSATGRDGRVTSHDVTPDARSEADGPVPQPRPTLLCH